MLKKLTVLSGLLVLTSTAFAAPPDVAGDAWFAATVNAFVDSGYVSSNSPFRPADKATRAEFVGMIVDLLGGVKSGPFSGESFDDVSVNHPHYEAFEEAGAQGWMKGAGSCYGSHPCYGNPDQPINRAEASALLMRAFGLQIASNAPSFDDNSPNQWFTDHIKGAASLCVLRGDAGARRVRPADNMNRAEMAVMLSRALQRENYPNCSTGAVRPELPKAPERNAVSSRSKFSASSRGNSSASALDICTESEWFCDEWSACSTKGVQTRDCDHSVYCNEGNSEPETTRKCSYEDEEGAVMKANIEKWEKLHDEMIAKAQSYIPQGEPGRGGVARVAEIEEVFLEGFNEYVRLYNIYIRFTPDLLNAWKTTGKAGTIEKDEFSTALKLIIQAEADFKKLPIIWY